MHWYEPTHRLQKYLEQQHCRPSSNQDPSPYCLLMAKAERHAESISYASVFSGGLVLCDFSGYLWSGERIFWGQPVQVLATILLFAIASILWLAEPRRDAYPPILRAFLIALTTAWVAHWILYRIHGDAMNYTAALYVPILLMVLLKPPRWAQVRAAVFAFAWTITTVLVLTRLLEAIGVLQIKEQPQGVIDFDEARYFLPFNDLLGIDGRWPGPFGHNGDTAMMAALLVVIAFAFWTRASWIFLAVGVFVLTLTDGRASIGALACGLIIIWMFSNARRLDWAPRWVRIVTGVLVLLAGALLMFLRPAGLTGRERIWPAFLELWWESPWIGVGGSGFATGNEITQQFGHAHSLYIEELARSGLIGFVAQFVALGIGVFIAARAAGIGYPGPLAVMVAYFVTGVTEPRNNWIEPSATWFLLILMVLAASARLVSEERNRSTDREDDSLPSSPPA